MKASAQIFAPLGVVRRSRTHRMGPRFHTMAHQSMELIDRERLGVEFAADLIQRRQWVVTVKGSVFHAFGRNRATDLLEFERELPSLGRQFVRQCRGMFEKEYGSDEIKHRGRQGAIATFRQANSRRYGAVI